jgi:hypothetical protein
MLKRKYVLLVAIASIVLLLSLSLMGIDGCAKKYTLTTNVSPAGGGFVTPSGGEYDDGTVVTLVATPASGYDFAYWSGSVSGTNPAVTLAMDENKSVIAFFEAIPEEYTLTVNVSPAGAGSVSPSGGQFVEGTVVTLTATPASGYDFDYWGGAASGSSPTTSITMNSNASVTAYFTSAVLFYDDFSYDAGYWDVYSDSDGQVFFANGQLHVLDYNTSLFTWSYAWQWFTDFILEVETELIAGTDDNWQTVTARDDGSNWYDFSISADGYYGIWRVVNGSFTNLAFGTSPYINQGWGVVNLMHVECVGNRLSLSVNGHLLDEVYDSTHSSGDISLAAEALTGSYTEVAFDNIIVVAP